MSCFFDACVRCKMTFTDENSFAEHMKSHTSGFAPDKKPIDEVAEQVKLEAKSVPGISDIPDEDTQLAAVKKVSGKRKKLIAAGIEAATMTPNEVESRYAEEKKKGTVK